jgi:hypothetical protein
MTDETIPYTVTDLTTGKTQTCQLRPRAGSPSRR